MHLQDGAESHRISRACNCEEISNKRKWYCKGLFTLMESECASEHFFWWKIHWILSETDITFAQCKWTLKRTFSHQTKRKRTVMAFGWCERTLLENVELNNQIWPSKANKLLYFSRTCQIVFWYGKSQVYFQWLCTLQVLSVNTFDWE